MNDEQDNLMHSDGHNDEGDVQLDRLIRDHLHRELDSHLGVASRRFAQDVSRHFPQRTSSGTNGEARAVALSARNAQTTAGPKRGPNFGSFWSIGLVGAALAATLTIVSMRHTLPSRIGAGSDNRNVLPHVDNGIVTPVSGEANVAWSVTPQDIVQLSDGTLARRYLEKRTDTYRGFDSKSKREIEFTQPREQTVYVPLKQY